MTPGQLLLGAVALALLLLGVRLLVTVRRLGQDVAQVRQAVERLGERPVAAAYTDQPVASRPLPEPAEPAPSAQASLVTAVLGVPLLKLAAFSFGLRQALSEGHRQRIARVVEQELRASRRRRRAALAAARRTAARAR